MGPFDLGNALLASNIGPILAQYCAQYCPNVGSATQRQYWPILLTNIGPMLAIDIGPMLVKHVVQYWPNIGHNIAPILAALHNDNIGQYCWPILGQYWLKIATILASAHSYVVDITRHAKFYRPPVRGFSSPYTWFSVPSGVTSF